MGVYIHKYEGKRGTHYRFIISDKSLPKKLTEKGVTIRPNDPFKAQKLKKLHHRKAVIELELLNKTYGKVGKNNQKIKDYLINRVDGYKKGSRESYMAITKHLDAFFPDRYISEISENDCQDFLDYMYSVLSINSANTYFTKFKRVMGDAVRDEIIRKNPCDHVRKKAMIRPQIKDVIMLDDFKKLVNTPFKRANRRNVREICIFAFFTGCGFADIKILEHNQIREGTLYYNRIKTGVPVIVKLNKSVIIPKKTHDRLIFPNLPDPATVHNILKDWTKEAGLDIKLGFYGFRHSFAVRLILAGTPLPRVMKLLGHANIETTLKYTRFVETMDSNEDELEGL